MLTVRRLLLTLLTLVTTLLMVTLPAQATNEPIKPFVLASVSSTTMADSIAEVKAALGDQGFSIIGEYTPYPDAHIVIATHDQLLSVAASTPRGGYAAVQRVSVTRSEGKTQVAYVNPRYIQHAYRVNGELTAVADRLQQALGAMQTFGSEKGLSAKKLRKYNYTLGMEHFDDPYRFIERESHAAAVAAVEQGLSQSDGELAQVYRLDIPGTEMTLFGVSMTAGADGDVNMDDRHQMQIIDFLPLKQTAYLPYAILVNGNEVEALHMRFRAAVHFPDLSMMGENSFMKLMKSPLAIENAIAELFSDNR